MVSIVSLEDSSLHLPPEGRVYEGRGQLVDEFHAGVAFDTSANWHGPVRKMAGEGDNDDRSFVYGLKRSVPYWHDQFAYQTSGNFSIELPPGEYGIAAMRGNEYVPIRDTIRIPSGRSVVTKTYVLKRWIDLPAMGWYSGDVHVHHLTTTPQYRNYLLQYAKAEDLHVVNVLMKRQYSDPDGDGLGFWNILARQAGFGRDHRFQLEDYVLVPGQEHPQSVFGHVLGLNIEHMVRPDIEQLDVYEYTFQALQDQDAPVGYAHFSWNGTNLPMGFPWLVTTGKIDFVSMLQFRHLNDEDYHQYLNLGFKLAAAAGSDVPFGSTLGEVRTYVYTGNTFDVDQWYEGLKQGNTFVSNGPALEFTVDDHLPGSEIHVEPGHSATVKVTVRSHPAIGSPKFVRVVGHDGVIQEFTPSSDTSSVIEGEMEVPVDRSQWLAASTVCNNGAVAHTSPVYVVVNNQPFYNPVKAPAIIDEKIAAIDSIEHKIMQWDDGSRKAAVMGRIQQARRFYEDLKMKISKAE